MKPLKILGLADIYVVVSPVFAENNLHATLQVDSPCNPILHPKKADE